MTTTDTPDPDRSPVIQSMTFLDEPADPTGRFRPDIEAMHARLLGAATDILGVTPALADSPDEMNLMTRGGAYRDATGEVGDDTYVRILEDAGMWLPAGSPDSLGVDRDGVSPDRAPGSPVFRRGMFVRFPSQEVWFVIAVNPDTGQLTVARPADHYDPASRYYGGFTVERTGPFNSCEIVYDAGRLPRWYDEIQDVFCIARVMYPGDQINEDTAADYDETEPGLR